MRNNPCLVVVCAVCLVLLYGSQHTHAIVQTDKTKGPGVAFIGAEELKGKLSGGQRVAILDVRSSDGYAHSDEKISGALHMKVRRIKHRLSFAPMKGVPKNSLVVTYCSCPADESAIAAARILLQNGFTNVRVLKGGWREWQKISGQTEKKPRL